LKKRSDLQTCADELVDLANKKGGRDNITLILIENDGLSDLGA
jgi:serine/threonine protein phosphatase PrpC